jgi:16S rRNA (guanine966-N2)-methyltransferase
MLKIGAGKYRSRSLEVPASLTVPSKSITRLAIGNALSDLVSGAQVLDLFAGSGALGFEMLSRGAAFCDFVDLSSEATLCIAKNAQTLKETNLAIYHLDYQDALSAFANKKHYDIVLLDPPYAMKEVYRQVPETLLKLNLLSPEAALVLEYEGEIEAPLSLYASSRIKARNKENKNASRERRAFVSG